ncbi:glycoside hydrolase family 25 protein [Bacillus sp. C1]
MQHSHRGSKRKAMLFIFILISGVIAITAVLIFQGIIIPNHLHANKFSVKGVDVASYQGKIDWGELEGQGIKFAFMKATEGSSFVDQYFSENWNDASKTNMRIGAYHFFSFDSNGKTQAEQYIRTVPKNGQALPPVIDVEFYGNKKANPPKREDVARELTMMIQMLEKHYEKRVILYATSEAYDLYIKGNYPECDIWIRSVLTKPSLSDDRNWMFWQYTNRGRLKGYSGKEKFIDLNVFRGTVEEFEKYGMNP